MSKKLLENRCNVLPARDKLSVHGFEARNALTNGAYVPPEWMDLNKYPVHNEHLIKKLIQLDEELHIIIKNQAFIDNWNNCMDSRSHIKKVFVDLLKYEMKFVRQHNIEQYFWKILYYNILECLKRHLNDARQSNRKFFYDSYLEIVNDGVLFFQDLLEILSKKYQYNLNDFIGVHSGRSLKGLKYISLAIVSSQKICIYIGDLLRYKELLNESGNFEVAKSWYIKAHQLIPTNGLPINQLAILALYKKRKFEAIFYHMRSLHVSNPIKSAKESLLVLFDELRKKYETINSEKQNNEFDVADSIADRLQREIWIHPIKGEFDYRTIYLDQETETLPHNNLYKRFLTHFLHFHGMLFTGIGTESLNHCFTETLNLFDGLLFNSAQDTLTFEKLIQLLVLNILLVENGNVSANLRNYSIAFVYNFIALTMNKLVKEITEIIDIKIGDSITEVEENKRIQYKIKSIKYFAFPDIVNNLLATCALWCDWMQLKKKWCSPEMLQSINNLMVKNKIIFWEKFVTLLNLLEKFRSSVDEILPENGKINDENQTKAFRTPTEMLFLEMAVLFPDKIYDLENIDISENIYLCLHMKKILNFGCKFLSPSLISKDEDGKYVFNNISESPELSIKNVSKPHATVRSDAIRQDSSDQVQSFTTSIENMSLEESQTQTDVDGKLKCIPSEIQTLLQRKSELEKSHKLKEQHAQLRNEILQDKKNNKLIIEVHPKFLVPDTNCFVDFLPEFQIIAESYPTYQLIIPLVVLNELEGLTKGNTEHHSKETSINAQEAVNFLNKIGKIKYASTMGSIIYRKAFTNHECSNNEEYLNNDDKILLTAVNLSKSSLAKNDLTKECTKLTTKCTNLNFKTIKTNLVLLTNDRNLKLKAITQNVPVREILDFIKWSKLSVPKK